MRFEELGGKGSNKPLCLLSPLVVHGSPLTNANHFKLFFNNRKDGCMVPKTNKKQTKYTQARLFLSCFWFLVCFFGLFVLVCFSIFLSCEIKEDCVEVVIKFDYFLNQKEMGFIICSLRKKRMKYD
jgi:hypothetical protein